MSGEERRAAIIKAVLPLFAKNGFANTTTKEIAEAARVSEALIYKHFPSKEVLYSEIQKFGCQGREPALEKIGSLEPSTSTLVFIVYYVIRNLILGHANDPIGWETRQRLILNSCLQDGSYPRFLFENHRQMCFPKIEACMEAAERAGDLVEVPGSKQNRILFMYHVGCMVAAMLLPTKPVVDYEVTREDLVNQACWFVLRGLGLTDTAICNYFNPKALGLFLGGEKN